MNLNDLVAEWGGFAKDQRAVGEVYKNETTLAVITDNKGNLTLRLYPLCGFFNGKVVKIFDSVSQVVKVTFGYQDILGSCQQEPSVGRVPIPDKFPQRAMVLRNLSLSWTKVSSDSYATVYISHDHSFGMIQSRVGDVIHIGRVASMQIPFVWGTNDFGPKIYQVGLRFLVYKNADYHLQFIGFSDLVKD